MLEGTLVSVEEDDRIDRSVDGSAMEFSVTVER